MFASLLAVTFLVALLTSLLVVAIFARPIATLLARIVSDQLAPIWKRYILFAIVVVGVAGGVRVWDLERYITPDKDGKLLVLTADRWIVEIYKTIIGSLQSSVWLLMIFFVFALLAYVVVRGFESRNAAPQ
ncbi:MAG: hypothetical protein KGM96_06125 [Acidobacteriota bacterium]|nr:hypothetical protein [Acidobacteriota bacterium]